jgi:transposase-like protein
MQEMETSKKQNSRQQYASDFKEEIIRMLNSGKKVQELSKTFGIGEYVLYN